MHYLHSSLLRFRDKKIRETIVLFHVCKTSNHMHSPIKNEIPFLRAAHPPSTLPPSLMSCLSWAKYTTPLLHHLLTKTDDYN
jgi:hypothetical protein